MSISFLHFCDILPPYFIPIFTFRAFNTKTGGFFLILLYTFPIIMLRKCYVFVKYNDIKKETNHVVSFLCKLLSLYSCNKSANSASV